MDSSVFPWIRHLPENEVRQFIDELEEALDSVKAEACPGVIIPVQYLLDALDGVITSWMNTALVHANPDLLEALTRPLDIEGDFVEAPRPGSDGPPISVVDLVGGERISGGAWVHKDEDEGERHPADDEQQKGRPHE